MKIICLFLRFNLTNFYAKPGPSGVVFKGPLWHPMRYFSLFKRYVTLGDVFISSGHPIRKSPHQDSPYILRALSNLISLNMFILVPIFYWNIFRFRRTQDLITGRNDKNDTILTFWKIYQDSAGVKGGEGRRATCSQPKSTSLHGFSRF